MNNDRQIKKNIVFALLAPAGCYVAWATRKADINRVAYRHSSLTSLLHVMVAGYLAAYGMLGYRTWV